MAGERCEYELADAADEVAEDTARIIGQRVTEESSNTLLSHPYYWAPFILIGNDLIGNRL